MPRHVQVLLLLITCLVPYRVWSGAEPYEQEFIITAYYSPLPDQCCYVKGGYDADKVLNGQGIAGADGTAVYPGMIAAPPSYAFGTKVDLPGIGTLTVHDRGGAIQELDNGAHRLDIWVGHGEAGLARALAFGVVRVKGTVYPPGSSQPAAQFNLSDFQTPLNKLLEFQLDGTNLLDVSPQLNEFSYSTVMLQEKLKELGYFDHAVTGKFGEVTQASLRRFIQDFQVGETDAKLTEKTAAYILAALKRRAAERPLAEYVDENASPASLQQAQRLLRFAGYYRGRTDGKYSGELVSAILKFQQDHGLVGTRQDPGAGQIGPITRQHLVALWDRRLVARQAEKYVLLQRIKDHVEGTLQLDRFLEEGNYGPRVRQLQQALAAKGYFASEEINGSFGPQTKEAVMKFQLDRGIIGSPRQTGAGRVGPNTLSALQQEQMKELYQLVRAQGIGVL